ncbi:uncharacterized protein LOC111075155 [Drosophila obscura]|uniref:uncharacterized protein LOC111075155 n=1 Tax=Drosophila obscura TaxID=7282 RepID=UPI000B9FE831|nr:uncharacterized protein LOC111075155 [Drosophila obscura]
MMSNSNWYKWIDVDYNSAPRKLTKKPETIPRCDQVGAQIRAILLEQDANLPGFSRKQAGLDSQKRKSNKFRLTKMTPRVYKFQDIYEKHKKELRKLYDKSMRTKYQFHSHPMPDFDRLHRRLERSSLSLASGQNFTTPRTPHTLVMSMQAERRRELEMKEYKKNTTPKFVPKINRYPLAYMHRQPFVPRIVSSIIHAKPFHLRSEERGVRRKVFDQQINQKMEERCRREAMEWAKQQEKEYFKQRRQTVFKARPNPWKRTRAPDAISHQ